ncbi:DUF2169 domain-containing protein [Massilia sp. CCM 9210]|uniref:DUF2169 family type VI secretion system accessory protein n=1 Tax=Massilia scottii TaxID=3057166 RepID=UPI002796736A|nr:DUF2169 domain-containing protein [Massilia sp. CCM 9210]MDQ1812070.1 DUF2169 domain-containing protein [Massilia sp. CCM 9210]
MKIVKPLTLGVLHRPYRHRGAHRFVIAALGFFRLGADHPRFLTENLQWPKVMQSLPSGRPLDDIMPKQRAEALLAGQAFAPAGKALGQMHVRLRVGQIDKSLRVWGERQWRYGLLPRYAVSQPQPFLSMPLVYERAYGGAHYPANPTGRGPSAAWFAGLRGRTSGPMHNLDYPQSCVLSRAKPARPAGFGAIDLGWAPRKDKHGSFDQRWLREDAPGLARDIDWSIFNVAPADQWQDGYFSGGEAYRLEGLHPALPVIEGRLPRSQARAFVVRDGQSAAQAEEVPLNFDTVWFFPEHELGCVLFHGQTTIGDSDALDIDALMIAYEHAGQPKSVEHYRHVLALRLDPREGSLHAFNESQLAPEHTPVHLAERSARKLVEQAAHTARQQAVLDEMSADHWARSGTAAPAGYQAPRAGASALDGISLQDIRDGDFDLCQLMEQARGAGAQAKARGAAALAALREQQAALPPAAPPDTAATQAGAFDRASVVAGDLLPAGTAGGAMLEPQLAALLGTLSSAATPEQTAQLRKALASLPALRRRGRNAAITPAFPAVPLAPEQAAWLGEQIRQWQQGGAFLAGRDLAGADLRGADFNGADLREVLLEQADLREATFVGANLSGAVLAGARIDGADFSGARLDKANLCHSHGTGARFARADLSHARAIGAVWPRADLSEAILADLIALNIDLSGALLDRAQLLRCALLNAKAPASSWNGAHLDKVVAFNADLAAADFSGATLVKAVLLDAQLCASVWRRARLNGIYGGGKADWSGADLSGARADACGWHGANLRGASLTGGQFLRCDFGQCDMRDTDLRGALLARSLFMRTSLRNAKANGADFFQALCRKADFSCADLRHASLVQAECGGATFEHACLQGLHLERHRSLAS